MSNYASHLVIVAMLDNTIIWVTLKIILDHITVTLCPLCCSSPSCCSWSSCYSSNSPPLSLLPSTAPPLFLFSNSSSFSPPPPLLLLLPLLAVFLLLWCITRYAAWAGLAKPWLLIFLCPKLLLRDYLNWINWHVNLCWQLLDMNWL